MRFFLISCAFCLILACGSYPKRQNLIPVNLTESSIRNPYFSDITKDYVYKASINVYNNTFGGLLIIKKIAPKQFRIAFTTEMGNKLFDFSLLENELTVNYCISELNRKVLLNILKQDFSTLTTEDINVETQFKSDRSNIFETELYKKTHFFYISDHLEKIVRSKYGKEQVAVVFSNIENHTAKAISIKHSNIKLSINLKSIY